MRLHGNTDHSSNLVEAHRLFLRNSGPGTRAVAGSHDNQAKWMVTP